MGVRPRLPDPPGQAALDDGDSVGDARPPDASTPSRGAGRCVRPPPCREPNPIGRVDVVGVGHRVDERRPPMTAACSTGSAATDAPEWRTVRADLPVPAVRASAATDPTGEHTTAATSQRRSTGVNTATTGVDGRRWP